MVLESIGKHAVIVGAGISGLAAAGAVTGFFERVTVLERDELPPGVSSRPGTPHDVHLHGLFLGGQRAFGELFPGFTDDLAEAGAVPLILNRDMREEFPGFDPCFPQRDLGGILYTMSRPMIEFVARRRVRELPNVTLRDCCRVVAIMAGNDGSATGVRLEGADGNEEELPADLVIDASRSGTLTLSFLEATGQPRPEQTEIGIDLTYASTIFAIPDGPHDWKGIVTIPQMPESLMTGYLVSIEGNRWIVLISDRHSPMPSADPDEFMRRAQLLRTPTIYDAIKDAERLEGIHRFSIPANTWRHFEQLQGFPRGLLPIGDAICRFNPVYGQGMTVAAREACILKSVMQDRAGTTDPLAGLGQAFLSGIHPLIADAWSQSAIPDFIHPQTRGERPANLENILRFGGGVLRLAARDPDVHKMMSGVRHLVEPSSALRDPAFARRVEAELAGT